MAKVIDAFRQAAMNDRLRDRVDDLIQRFHLFGDRVPFGRGSVPAVWPDYEENDDGSEVQIKIIVRDEDAIRAASELRACGFVVAEPYDAKPRPPTPASK
jgi:hypothetical protein